MRLFCFRRHCGGFAESMKTKATFVSLYGLILHVARLYGVSRFCVQISFSSFDDRVLSDSYLVSILSIDKNGGYYPVGYMWFEDEVHDETV